MTKKWLYYRCKSKRIFTNIASVRVLFYVEKNQKYFLISYSKSLIISIHDAEKQTWFFNDFLNRSIVERNFLSNRSKKNCEISQKRKNHVLFKYWICVWTKSRIYFSKIHHNSWLFFYTTNVDETLTKLFLMKLSKFVLWQLKNS